jgi:hypothetical protein
LRRLVIIGTVLTALVGAAAAYAVTHFNSYKGSKVVLAPKVAGSSAHPMQIGETEVLKAAGPTGDRAAPLVDIKTTIYGAKLNGGKIPKCTDKMIEAAGAAKGFDAACPKGSMIGQGPVHALLGSGADPSVATGGAVTCNTVLHVYNGGPRTQVYFFTTKSASDCGGLKTGDTAPYDGHISYKGKNLVVNVPLPADISTKVAGQTGLYGSLISETLIFKKSKYMTSIACANHGKRPWEIQFTARDYNGGTETQTMKGTDKC